MARRRKGMGSAVDMEVPPKEGQTHPKGTKDAKDDTKEKRLIPFVSSFASFVPSW
jgi:hypothetical protein